MKPSLQPGISLTRKILIDRERTIGFMGEDARVYATPSMILDIERTCRDLILQHTDAGEDSVGIEVAIKHLAATLPGMTVEIDVRVTAVEGRKVTFEVMAKDQIEIVRVPDRGERSDQLRANAVDVADGLRGRSARVVRADPLLALVGGGGAAIGIQRSVRGLDSAAADQALADVWLTDLR